MKLDFYYFSYQCPLNDNMIRLLDEYRDRIEICMHDFSDDRVIAAQMQLFFPTLTVLDEEKRYYAPLNRTFLEQAAQGKYPQEVPYLPNISAVPAYYSVSPITLDNADRACGCCGNKTPSNCLKKKAFLERFPQSIYGYIHMDENGTLLGGAEYLPAEAVPYAIPHDRNTAFITCVYMSDPEFDYKSAPLKALEDHLKKQYAKVIAISDETGVFPNGDLKFFIRNGYKDEGILFEDPHYCRLHLVSKML